jgi:hypothetical protein
LTCPCIIIRRRTMTEIVEQVKANETMKELLLPSGKTAMIRSGKGLHLMKAQRVAKDAESIAYALVAELTEIDGKRILYDDLLEMDLKDVLALQAEVAGNFTAVLPATSSTSVT